MFESCPGRSGRGFSLDVWVNVWVIRYHSHVIEVNSPAHRGCRGTSQSVSTVTVSFDSRHLLELVSKPSIHSTLWEAVGSFLRAPNFGWPGSRFSHQTRWEKRSGLLKRRCAYRRIRSDQMNTNWSVQRRVGRVDHDSKLTIIFAYLSPPQELLGS